MTPTRTHRPQTRRRWVLFLLVIAALSVTGAGMLREWLVRRAGPDFGGAPGQLVPANAALVARWPDAAKFVDLAARLHTTRTLLGDSGLAELLLPPATADPSDGDESTNATAPPTPTASASRKKRKGSALPASSAEGTTDSSSRKVRKPSPPLASPEDMADDSSAPQAVAAPKSPSSVPEPDEETPSVSSDARRLATRALAKRFVDTCLGGEAVVAVLPPLVSPAPDARADATSATSALLIVTRTNAGFDENLAEFVAGCYPELALETRLYRGCRLQRYNARKTRRAFGYCRFGSTVALVLRSADWRRLEAVVDQRLQVEPVENAAGDTAATGSKPAASVPHVWPGETAPWLAPLPGPTGSDNPQATATAILYCEPHALPDALEALPVGGKVPEEETPGIAELLAIWCPETAYVTATLGVSEKGLVLDTRWHGRPASGGTVSDLDAEDSAHGTAKKGPAAPAAPAGSGGAGGDAIGDYLATLPQSAPICLAVAWPELGTRARTTYDNWMRAVWGKDLKDFESAFRKATDLRFDGEFLPQMDGFAGLGVMGVADNALLALPRARMALRLKSSAVATSGSATAETNPRNAAAQSKRARSAMADETAGAALTMLGILQGARDGDWLRLALNESPEASAKSASRAPGKAKTLQDSALLSRPPALPATAPALSALVLADFDAVTPMLERTLAALGLWSKKARRDADSWQPTLDLLHHLHALRLRAWHEGEEVRVDLTVPMD